MEPHLVLCSEFLDFTNVPLESILFLDLDDIIFRSSIGFSLDSKDETEQKTAADIEFFETIFDILDVVEIVVVVVKFCVVRGIEFKYSKLNLAASPLKVESLKLNFRLS